MRGSTIVNCGSIAGLEGNKTLIDYASTKGAIHAVTKLLALNLADRKIPVNGVSPGKPLNALCRAVCRFVSECVCFYLRCFYGQASGVEQLSLNYSLSARTARTIEKLICY